MSTRLIRNIDPTGDSRRIVDLDLVVPAGETAEVDEALAGQLLEQSSVWQAVEAKKSSKLDADEEK